MKLNDPFGRMERRHQVGYESMRDSLRRGGVLTAQAAEEVLRKSKKRALKFLGAGVVVSLLVIILLPKALPWAVCLALLWLVWVVNSTLNGQRYIRRYIDEDLR